MIWREFKALGSEIIIAADLHINQEDILLSVKKETLEFEKNFSRFIPGNELNIFNNSTESKRNISFLFGEMLKKAREYYYLSSGIFDPTIISSLNSLGYDQDFDVLDKLNSQQNQPSPDLKKIVNEFESRSKMTELEVYDTYVICAENFKIDLGGLGKGFIVDYLADKYFSSISDYYISAGGDLLISGNQIAQRGWQVAVQDPRHADKNIFSINTGGEKIAIATSGIIKRHGKKGKVNWHHIIDPRTGLSVDNNILSVTLIASTTLRADIFAKTVLILGTHKGLELIEGQADAACVIFLSDGSPIYSSRMNKYLKDKI